MKKIFFLAVVLIGFTRLMAQSYHSIMKSTPCLSRFLLLATVFFYLSPLRVKAISSAPLPNQLNVFSSVLKPDTLTAPKVKSITEFTASLKDANGVFLKLKVRRQLLKEQLHAIRQSPDKTKNQKVLLTILAVLAFIGVVSILWVIGYNGGAGLWPVVGLLVSIFLLVIVIKRIWKKRKNKMS